MGASLPDSVPQCFRQQAAQRPHSVALRSRESRLSYAELDSAAHSLALKLRQVGVGKGTFAGVLLPRSVAAITSFLAVLQSGGAFVPLDPLSPPEFVQGLVRRHGLACVVTSGQELRRFPKLGAAVPIVDIDEAAVPPGAPAAELPEILPADPACVMFTSGSTGEPKGAVISHRAIVRLVKDPGYMPFTSDQVFLQSSPLGFDASIFEVWGALLNGAGLFVPEEGLLSLDAFAAAIEAEGVTTLFLTSGLFNLMVEQKPAALGKLRYLIAGGDVMSSAHCAKAARHLAPGHFIVAYGPTENTTFTTTFQVPPNLAEDRSVPIGLPIAGTVVRILDEHMKPVPEGDPGELYVGGSGLALGYLGAPDLTEQKFVADPEIPTERLYRTGDLVRRDGNGVLHFLGRRDNQLKINGFRVEPEHVEIVLRRNLPVADIAVVACPLANGAKHLAAFAVLPPSTILPQDVFAEIAHAHLPPHMVPSRLEIVDTLPLTPTGKIDRLALARLAAEVRGQQSTPPVQDFAPIEASLRDVWRRHLQLENIAADQNFFDLGGTSLQLLGVHADLDALFPGRLSLQDLFDLPTIRLLHARLSGAAPRGGVTQAAARAALQRRARASRAPASAVSAKSGAGC